MIITSVAEQDDLDQLIDDATMSHLPMFIVGKTNNGVLIAEDDWYAIQQTLLIESLVELNQTLKEGMRTPIEQCSNKLDW
ncbi:type II toxin-antitoxin system prevent-host-death family antitoxin [Pseudidiomarina aestuarii]|uniref:Type II toxin-antitoxin system prevent-host-death family antitoxin n=2 Tax=Pseudidiomarina aestuarii TaxID=624146 RepID=A0A2T4D8Y5_9GAMM|nr:type II toxin-antitoxin system prevent-host-death family antitoxin [Pseudidiomarina aestuarii]PTB88456.1 type II toxin-antitoxin system prevent-host-death family antitoxin [Pseudidiomarina aestuarii]PTB90289.1 type II toxin-antitoxin system prevent-host-death family antitoxin [Pseudidiomarina aestuarii]